MASAALACECPPDPAARDALLPQVAAMFAWHTVDNNYYDLLHDSYLSKSDNTHRDNDAEAPLRDTTGTTWR